MARIKVLPDELVNKIAAGEVVERPASVVKELAENALDAGAKTVRVTLEGGGLRRVVVVDDGHGMSREDALLSLERHATSKLSDEAGLFELSTKGFRGEAVPAIASVSRFDLLTSEPGAALGTRLHLTGGVGLEVSDAAPLGGTRIEVEDLFFNTPARRKFMKREATELYHCEEAVVRLALAHPEVGFFVEHEGRAALSAPAADHPSRVSAVMGPEVTPHLLALEERRLGVTVRGFVASPELTLPTARRLYTFVNGRCVRDRGLTSAVQRAFLDSLPPGRQPIAVVLLEVDPARVDVNVHPQKLEVRFSEPREVQEATQAAVARALKAAPWRQRRPDGTAPQQEAHYAQAVERFLERAQLSALSAEAPALGERPPAFGEASPGLNEAPPSGYFTQLKVLGELAQRFWVCEGRGGSLVVVDPRAALERVVVTRLTRALEGGGARPNQGSLFSARVELEPAAAEKLAGQGPQLARLGLEVEPFGGGTLSVRAVPAGLEGLDLKPLLLELSTLLPDDASLPARAFAPALQAIAAHVAGPGPGLAEARTLFEQLDEADFTLRCAHPKIVVHEVTLLSLLPR